MPSCDHWGRGKATVTEEIRPEPIRPLGWWTISGADLLDALRRAHHGADPDIVYAEMYANSDVTDYGLS